MASFVTAIVVVVAAVIVTSGGGGLTSPITTSWQAGHALTAGTGTSTGHSGHGTWALMDDELSGTWQQNVAGPPPGYLTCPDSSTCFVMSGTYASDASSAPTADSLYSSTDFGSTWTDYPMPSGFVSTSPLACSDATDCAAAGNYNAQPVLITTSDGGHSFVVDPLPSGVGSLYSLSCPAAQYCAGLAATTADQNNQPKDATFLTTSDGGVQFSDAQIVAGDSMYDVVCSTVEDCTTVGVNDATESNPWTSGVSAITTDGGQSWTAASSPRRIRSELFVADLVRRRAALLGHRQHPDSRRESSRVREAHAAATQAHVVGAARPVALASGHFETGIRLRDVRV